MIYKEIKLPVPYTEIGIKNNNFQPTLTTYILENSPEIEPNRKRPLVLICPGGGYAMTSDREAEGIAIAMNYAGFHACVLRYSVAPMDFPASFLDLCQAIKYIRQQIALSEKENTTKDDSTNDKSNRESKGWAAVDTNKIIVAGFSAGGHLAATLGVHWKKELAQKYISFKPEEIKPNGLLLCYPVITTGKLTHQGSIENLTNANADLLSVVTLDKQVTKDTPPSFIWHCNDDDCVPVDNSFLFAQALRNEKVPVELHIFKHGGHGIGLATKETSGSDGKQIVPSCTPWVSLFATWLKEF